MANPLTAMACSNSPWSIPMVTSLTGATTVRVWTDRNLGLPVAVSVNGGLYAVLLGNTAQQGMGAIDPAVFAQHNDAKLRVWFSDGVNGFQQLSPDRPFASVPYAFSADTALNATIADGSINKSMQEWCDC